jgi:hypothetical protein
MHHKGRSKEYVVGNTLTFIIIPTHFIISTSLPYILPSSPAMNNNYHPLEDTTYDDLEEDPYPHISQEVC